jgi:hypothetical protein
MGNVMDVLGIWQIYLATEHTESFEKAFKNSDFLSALCGKRSYPRDYL